MEIGFDRKSRLAALAESRAASQLDWHGLRARFAAAHALGGLPERGEAATHAPVAGGSFDRRSARLLAILGRSAGAGSDGVNPTASGNGNSTYDNDAAVAGVFVTGDRG